MVSERRCSYIVQCFFNLIECVEYWSFHRCPSQSQRTHQYRQVSVCKVVCRMSPRTRGLVWGGEEDMVVGSSFVGPY